MNCPSCGRGLEEGARFCGVCGHELAPQVAGVAGDTVVTDKPIVLGAPAAGAPAAGIPAILQQTADPYIGKVLNNRFEVESKLGEGGFGAVYKAVQRVTGRVVALKLLHPEMTRDANLLERFRREGMLLCNLKDAHTITTYDFDQTPDGTLYIAMELLEGKSLHDVFHNEAPIDWRRMLRIVSQMCTSLAEAHSQGIVHRDLKPENIHLEDRPGNSEFVKILDFGIAKVIHGDGFGGGSPQLTATGQTLGTLEYMSPEQLMGKGLDGRSDVYALGVLSYELITGQLPFPDAKGPAQLITAQLKHTPKPPSVVCSGQVPSSVDDLILRMLQKDKNNRFSDVNGLRTEIDQLLASGGVAVATNVANLPGQAGAPGQIPGAARPAQNRLATPPSSSSPGQRVASGNKRGPSTAAAVAASQGSRAWMWIALAIVVVGGAVGAFLALR